MNNLVSKSIIRKEVLQKRNSLSPNERKIKSELICQKVISHPKFLEAEVILVYMPIKSEVSTISIIQQAWKLNKIVGFPKIEDNKMQFYNANNFSQLAKGTSSILEPETNNLIEPSKALIIMPGVAFDRNKNRIGYGKGFYDSYLTLHSQFDTITLAFDCQIVESIQTESHDIIPHYLITESIIIQ